MVVFSISYILVILLWIGLPYKCEFTSGLSASLLCVSAFMLVNTVLIIIAFVVLIEIRKYDTSSFKIALAICGLLWFCSNFRVFMYFYLATLLSLF